MLERKKKIYYTLTLRGNTSIVQKSIYDPQLAKANHLMSLGNILGPLLPDSGKQRKKLLFCRERWKRYSYQI